MGKAYTVPLRYLHMYFKANEILYSGLDGFFSSLRVFFWPMTEEKLKKELEKALTKIAELESLKLERGQDDEQIRYQANLLENVSDAIISSDLDFIVMSWNAAAEEIYGWKSGEALGKAFAELLKPQYPEESREKVIRQFLENGSYIGEVLHYHRDGRPINIWTKVSLVKDDQGIPTGSVAVNRDITKRRQAQKDSENLQAQLLQSQKMEAIGRLAGGVAHDFNNLLTSISGHVSLVQLDVDPDDPINESLIEIESAATRATELTSQLLAFSRKQLIKPKVIDINELIEYMHRMLVRIIGEDIILETSTGKQIGRIKADPGQVEQTVVNLAVNARDAMRSGGTLYITTDNVSLDEAYCKIHPNITPGNYVMLEVIDSGEGMDQKTLQYIFDPFFTTKERDKGTGLGLATVYGIVKQHGGCIDVLSQPGEGTTFRIYFPLVEEEAESIKRYAAVGDFPTGKETILLVEDDPMVKKVTIKSLARLGYKVLQAESGLEAIKLAEKNGDMIDLLLTDVIMPHMNGREVAEHINKRYPKIKVLYTSGYAEDVIAHHGILNEGLEFLGKPYTPEKLAFKVNEVLSKI